MIAHFIIPLLGRGTSGAVMATITRLTSGSSMVLVVTVNDLGDQGTGRCSSLYGANEIDWSLTINTLILAYDVNVAATLLL